MTLIAPLCLTGRTSRQVYWLVVALAFVAWLVAFAIQDFFGGAVSIAIILFFGAVFLLHTIRRLHDAGISRWWALLMFFPFAITFNAAWLKIGSIDLHLFDLSYLIRSAPILVAIILPSANRLDVSRTKEGHATKLG